MIRENETAIFRNNVNFLDDYVDQCLIDGRAFSIDAAKVHSYIFNFISDNKRFYPIRMQTMAELTSWPSRDFMKALAQPT